MIGKCSCSDVKRRRRRVFTAAVLELSFNYEVANLGQYSAEKLRNLSEKNRARKFE